MARAPVPETALGSWSNNALEAERLMERLKGIKELQWYSWVGNDSECVATSPA